MPAAQVTARSAGSPGGASQIPAPGAPQVFTSRLADVTIPSSSLPEYVLRRAAALGAKPAVIDAATGDSLSYAELAALAGSFAAGLATRGFGRGSVLAILAPNMPEYPVLFHGAARAGGAVTTLNPLWTAGEVAGQLRSSGARWLATVPVLAGTAETAAGDGQEIMSSVMSRFPERCPAPRSWPAAHLRARPSIPGQTTSLCPTPAARPACPKGSCSRTGTCWPAWPRWIASSSHRGRRRARGGAVLPHLRHERHHEPGASRRCHPGHDGAL